MSELSMKYSGFPGAVFASELRSRHASWFYATLGCAALVVLSVVAMSFDERTLNGISVWQKPFKFSLS